MLKTHGIFGFLTLLALLTACVSEGDRAPALVENPVWREARVEQDDGARRVANREPRARLEVLKTAEPVPDTWLLFWGDQTVARDSAGLQLAADTESHEVLMFDRRSSLLGALAPGSSTGDRLQRPQLVTAAPDGKLAAFQADGAVVVFDRWGREFRRLDPTFAYSVGNWRPDARLLLARSPYRVGFGVEPSDSPLLLVLDPARPSDARGIGAIHPAIQPIYTHAANAGTVAIDRLGNAYYAALARPELRKFGPDGQLIWRSSRPVPFPTPEPRLVPNPDGPPRLALATVQKAIAVGPDGLLYVRSAADASGDRDRLDVFDPENGEWMRSAVLDTGTAVMVGRRGAVWESAKRNLLEERTGERRAFPGFTLESFDGDTLSLQDLEGRVALVTFWASWCAPCRDELPLLDSLNAAIARPELALVGINEDVNESDAREFAGELDLRMTMLLGRGKMRARYHYGGLPYTVLLDREGRIVREYYGFGGRAAFDREVAARVLAELGSEGHSGLVLHSGSEGHRLDLERHLPEMTHDHGPSREVTGDEVGVLAAHLGEARAWGPASARDVPDAHWEVLLDGLAQVDARTNDFIQSSPGSFPLIQLMSLKTQLYVDAERIPALGDPGEFASRWAEHLRSIEYLLEAYQKLERSR